MNNKKSLSIYMVLLMVLGVGEAIADTPLTPQQYAQANSPAFDRSVMLTGLKNPHNLVWGGDNHLWLTEQFTGNVIRVNPETGKAQTVLNIADIVHDDHAQNGLLGIALDPQFGKHNHHYVYLSFTIKNPKSADPDYPNQTIIRRYTFDTKNEKLEKPVDIITGLPSSHDHQGARLLVGPDQKLYYSIGDQGANQLTYLYQPNLAQTIPTREQIAAKDWHAYAGKVLRLNLDGSIPKDNPNFAGVVSHIYTLGHRNPQGMSFSPSGKLFATEQGPNSDDELNLLIKGGNYGWPYVAGYKDNNGYAYANYSAVKDKAIKDIAQNGVKVAAGVPVVQESQWSAQNFVEPLKTFFTVGNEYNYNDPICGQLSYICWPTIAPSSSYFYQGGKSAIPDWNNSILITSLKRGVIFRVQLDDSLNVTKGDAIPLLRSNDRYRDVVASPEGNILYVITDSQGNVQSDTGSATDKLANPGALLKFTYVAKTQ